ncbi:MAG: phage terminase large subunit family protein, partial [Candidatus Tectomicrobia bacterium]|nr:phage terminase large subunit family protein [Candidatus Tectomicrobia bacterium]
RFRTMREFAEQEIIIPSGQFKDRKYSCSRQPFSAHWFDLVDTTAWPEMVITGPSQSGKTLIGFVIPICYYLFEIQETVIAAVPDGDMVRDKWEQDIEPVISRTRYAELIPKSGPGSKGGKVESIKFRNGSILRFMTAGGSDKSRAGFTARIICMTETDGFDVRTSTSEEADKIQQIEARARSEPFLNRRIFKECTVSVPDGHTWRKYESGTATSIKTPCPHCGDWVQLEREDFKGWQDAKTEVEAIEGAYFQCSSCAVKWSELDRVRANHKSQVLHRGQSLVGGEVEGNAPSTYTLGFRWSAVNNLLTPASDVGLDEWHGARAPDEDNEQRKLSQFVWSIPYQMSGEEEVKLTLDMIYSRSVDLGRGVCPDDTRWVTVGVDVNKPVLHWTSIAWRLEDEVVNGHIIDYGKQGVRVAALGFEAGVIEAVVKLEGKLGYGWSNTPEDRIYHRAVIDSRWQTGEMVKAVKALKNPRWRNFMGLGQGHWKKKSYIHPEKHAKGYVWVGNMAFERVLQTHKCKFILADANYWKTWLHSRLVLDDRKEDSAGDLSIFATTDERDRAQFGMHLTAEVERYRFEKGKGLIREWESIRSANHWLDSTYMACVAGHRCWSKHIGRRRRAVGQQRDSGAGDQMIGAPFSPFESRG